MTIMAGETGWIYNVLFNAKLRTCLLNCDITCWRFRLRFLE